MIVPKAHILSGLIIPLFLICIFSACVEIFIPELEGYENILIVDGKITDDEGPYSVQLYYSKGINSPDLNPVTGAFVNIREENGTLAVLSESEPGFYSTEVSDIRGKAGQRYRLEIELPEGKSYTSAYQTLVASPEIQDVRAELESNYSFKEKEDLPGYQFYVKGPPSFSEPGAYILWVPTATYRYSSFFNIYFEYWYGDYIPFPKPDSLRTCYKSTAGNQVRTYNPNIFNANNLNEVPLHFQKAESIELSDRYSLLVSQYVINEEAYKFWKGIESQLEADASLYTKQPYQIRGNIVNEDDASEIVLGFFLVAGVSEKRIFVDKPDIPLKPYMNCVAGSDELRFLSDWPSSSYPIYITTIGPYQSKAIANFGCLDCRELGGTIEKPEFWE